MVAFPSIMHELVGLFIGFVNKDFSTNRGDFCDPVVPQEIFSSGIELVTVHNPAAAVNSSNNREFMRECHHLRDRKIDNQFVLSVDANH